MFGTANVPVTVTRFGGIRLADKRQKDRSKNMEFAMETPFTRELCDDFLPDLVDVFFTDDEIRGGMTAIDLDVKTGIQKMIVRGHPDDSVRGESEGVTVRALAVKRVGDVWMLSWTAKMKRDPKLEITLGNFLRDQAYMTFERQDPELTEGEQPAAAPADDGAGKAKGRGRSRGRGRKERQPRLEQGAEA